MVLNLRGYCTTTYVAVLVLGIAYLLTSQCLFNLTSPFGPIHIDNMSHSGDHQEAHDHTTAAVKHASHHHDHQHHHHQHEDDDDFSEKNRKHWNQHAKSYTAEPWQKDMVARVTAFLRENIEWMDIVDDNNDRGSSSSSTTRIRILDYACGPGTVTAALGSLGSETGIETEYVGIDFAEGMVAAYNERFDSSLSTASAAEAANAATAGDGGRRGFVAKAHQGNLIAPPSPSPSSTESRPDPDQSTPFSGPEYQNFDAVIIGLGFHHFQDLPHATRALVSRLRPGGSFIIVDLVSHDHNHNNDNKVDEEVRHIVAHAGFGFETVKKLFEGEAGLVGTEWKVMDGEVLMRGKNPKRVFVARGKKPE